MTKPALRALFLPPWMAGMPEMQEHFPASAMDGGYAGNAGAFSGGAWMAPHGEMEGIFFQLRRLFICHD
jgi:hypothetical protein